MNLLDYPSQPSATAFADFDADYCSSYVPGLPILGEGEVHIWQASLSSIESHQADCLATDEISRANRFHFDRDRDRFIASRGAVRCILGRYTGQEPWEIDFATGPFGKPSISGPGSWLRFNVSHSQDLLLVALLRDGEVGVDIEAMRENLPFEMLARHYLAPADAWQVRIAPLCRQAQLFYAFWTTLEARLKATGRGLAADSLALDESEYFTSAFTPAPGFAAALAVDLRASPCLRSLKFKLHRFQWHS